MRFLVILCLLAFAAADEDTTQDKKTQQFDTVQNASSLTTAQPTSPLLNGQVFLPTSFSNVFGTNDNIHNLAYTGFNGNVSPVQAVQPDFFAAPAAGSIPVNSGIQLNSGVPVNSGLPVNAGIPVNTNIPLGSGIPVNVGIPTNAGIPVNSGIPINTGIPVNGAVQSFPVTRTVLPGSNAVVNGIQSTFPVSSNVFPSVTSIPAAVNTIQSQFPAIGTGILSGVPTGAIDPNTAAANGVISAVANPSYRFLIPEAFTGVASQGLQAAQQVGLAAIPAFTSGILPSLTNGVLQGQFQGQNIPAGIQQVLKNPTANPAGISSNVQGLQAGNIPTGPLTTVFSHA